MILSALQIFYLIPRKLLNIFSYLHYTEEETEAHKF